MLACCLDSCHLFDGNKTVLVIGGVSAIGTKSAIIGITKFWKDLLENYHGVPFATIVQGFDMDGDGKIDSIEILE